MLKKLRLKFILVNMIIVTLMLLVIFGLTVQHTGAGLERESESALQSLAYGAQPGDPGIHIPHFVLQVNIHGSVTISGNSYHDLTDEAFIQELVQAVYTREETTGYLEQYQLRYALISNLLTQKIVFVDVSGHAKAMGTLIKGCCIIGLAALVAFFIISMLLARWAVKPVERAWEQQKQFVSDASHELKTPLSVIMSSAELLQNPDFDEETKTRFADSILVMSRQMRSLVEGMLDLARADRGQTKKSFEILNLSSLVGNTLLPFEPVFFEKGLFLEEKVEPDIHVSGSSEHLRQVLEILLDNAAKYSQPGIVGVQLQRHGRNQCLLTVSNPGEPISQKDQKRIFERFYRVDTARSRTGSFGLGLPIARTIVESHRGKIWVASNETGNCFCVSLPCKHPEEMSNNEKDPLQE